MIQSLVMWLDVGLDDALWFYDNYNMVTLGAVQYLVYVCAYREAFYNLGTSKCAQLTGTDICMDEGMEILEISVRCETQRWQSKMCWKKNKRSVIEGLSGVNEISAEQESPWKTGKSMKRTKRKMEWTRPRLHAVLSPSRAFMPLITGALRVFLDA